MSWLFSLWTVLVAVLFAGVVWWAYRRGGKQEFERAARIPLEDDDAPGARSNGD